MILYGVWLAGEKQRPLGYSCKSNWLMQIGWLCSQILSLTPEKGHWKKRESKPRYCTDLMYRELDLTKSSHLQGWGNFYKYRFLWRFVRIEILLIWRKCLLDLFIYDIDIKGTHSWYNIYIYIYTHIYIYIYIYKNIYIRICIYIHTGDNTEKIWVHRFLVKPKTITAGGLGGAVSPPGGPGWCHGAGMGAKPPNNFFHIKKAKTVIIRVNIG